MSSDFPPIQGNHGFGALVDGLCVLPLTFAKHLHKTEVSSLHAACPQRRRPSGMAEEEAALQAQAKGGWILSFTIGWHLFRVYFIWILEEGREKH